MAKGEPCGGISEVSARFVSVQEGGHAKRRDVLTLLSSGRAGGLSAPPGREDQPGREPSLAVVQQLVHGCGLALSLQLFNEDGSLHALARDQQQLPAMARIASLLHDPDQLAALTATLAILPDLPDGVVLVGAVAAVLRGGPNRLTSGTLEIVPADPAGASEHLHEQGWLAGDITIATGSPSAVSCTCTTAATPR